MFWYPVTCAAHRGSLQQEASDWTKEYPMEVFIMSRWPAAWPRRVSPEAVGLTRAYSFATVSYPGRGLEARPRAPVMLSIPVFLGGALGSRVCQPCGTGPPPRACRRSRLEPSLPPVIERSPLGKSAQIQFRENQYRTAILWKYY